MEKLLLLYDDRGKDDGKVYIRSLLVPFIKGVL